MKIYTAAVMLNVYTCTESQGLLNEPVIKSYDLAMP